MSAKASVPYFNLAKQDGGLCFLHRCGHLLLAVLRLSLHRFSSNLSGCFCRNSSRWTSAVDPKATSATAYCWFVRHYVKGE